MTKCKDVNVLKQNVLNKTKCPELVFFFHTWSWEDDSHVSEVRLFLVLQQSQINWGPLEWFAISVYYQHSSSKEFYYSSSSTKFSSECLSGILTLSTGGSVLQNPARTVLTPEEHDVTEGTWCNHIEYTHIINIHPTFICVSCCCCWWWHNYPQIKGKWSLSVSILVV